MKKEVTTVVPSEETIATALTQQYEITHRSIQQSVENVLHFGAMLIKAEEVVIEAQDGLKHKGTSESVYGLQAWLSSHCPTINYKTAMRWKGIAERAAGTLGCDRSNAVALLAGEAVSPDLPEAEMRERVSELYNAGSLKKLSQMCFNFAADDKEPPAGKGDYKKLSRKDEARVIWTGVLSVIGKSAVKDAIPLLPEKEARLCYETLGDLRKLLKDHLDASF